MIKTNLSKLICISLCIGSFVFFLSFSSQIFAQSLPTQVATYIVIPGKIVAPGTIISINPKQDNPSNVDYDPTAFAVTVKNPSVVMENQNTLPANSYAIVTQGKAYVRVTTSTGKIAAGDLLTTSTTPGVAQKVTRDGYMIGTALESYDNSNPKKEGLILTNLTFTFYTDPNNKDQNLIANIHQSLTSPYLGPGGLLRYIAAALIIIVAFGFGIGYFGRIISKGMESLGRNPLASRIIMISIGLNLVLMLVVLAVGLAVAYFILVL